MTKEAENLFITALHDLHNEAPIELLKSLRKHLDTIRQTNPNSAQTAQACLVGLSSDTSTLLHVLTAAYIMNGGVMIKQHMQEEETRKQEIDSEFNEFEEELRGLSLSMTGTSSHTSSLQLSEEK